MKEIFFLICHKFDVMDEWNWIMTINKIIKINNLSWHLFHNLKDNIFNEYFLEIYDHVVNCVVDFWPLPDSVRCMYSILINKKRRQLKLPITYYFMFFFYIIIFWIQILQNISGRFFFFLLKFLKLKIEILHN